MVQAFLIRLDVTNAKKVSLNTFFQVLFNKTTLFGEYVRVRDFFKSREKFFSETESRFQLQMSNDHDDDVEIAALRRETSSTQGRFSTRTVQATPCSEFGSAFWSV